MKKIFTILFFTHFIATFPAFAQNSARMNFGAALAAHNATKQEKLITLLVQGNVTEIQAFTERAGGTYRYSIGDIASVILKAKDILLLSEKTFVNRIEAANPYSKTQVMSDTMLIHNRVLPVHAGNAPLSQAYKGNGVVVGIIDTGIDYNHPDFKRSNGKSRIKFLWDQTLPDSVPPLPYNYGQEWNSIYIDNGKATATRLSAESSYGHGTHVSSVACGNGLAVNKYAGVAPNADIIFVACDLNNPNGILDAANYIYTKAASLGEPCVINVSLGDYYGSHDGTNLEAQAIQSLITAQTGRSFVAAAGNAGEYAFHVGYKARPDSNFTWFSGGAYIAMYADQAEFNKIKFAIGADKVSPYYSFRGNTAFSHIGGHIGQLEYDTIYNGSNRICTMLSYGDFNNGVNSMEYLITPDSSYFWRLMTTGSGKFDVWTFDMETANLADSLIYPPLKKYKQPDFNSNMVSSYQCLNEVITVGNYTNRNQYIDYDNNLQIDPTRTQGDLFSSSSHGPTRDGRIKPDITSPGDWTMGALVTSKIAYSISVGNSYLMGQGGYHVLDGGTSNASPSVAGIVALYLQMQPSAAWLDVKNAITNCARLDTYTGLNLPDNYWGYGKADALAMMTGCATSINNNQTSEFEELNMFPNPASNEVNFIINVPDKDHDHELLIYNVIGKKVKTIKVQNSGPILIRKGSLPNGIYFCTLRNAEKIIITKKLIISE